MNREKTVVRETRTLGEGMTRTEIKTEPLFVLQKFNSVVSCCFLDDHHFY